jgi:hypothetical protein
MSLLYHAKIIEFICWKIVCNIIVCQLYMYLYNTLKMYMRQLLTGK